ncbi:5-formyltetrahydrofolate cyclo-ligase [Haloarchaeobius amylolyticus]|uniref:5-formyltetrahydrofolate cyclo-ligase n=1 Tax=Haloarchaeobius amylolyticus TaxID=1198296 RepID=UPI0026E54A86|nr:5-formyltetrahydrofolate cyclo-ligase [Haloarchaeobius amylolyticus]
MTVDKQALRERVWDALEEQNQARFPFPPHGRIPNFKGCEAAAERVVETAVWQAAESIKANPDSPQKPLRRAALEAGKTVYMAVPRLRDEKPFLELDPARIDDIDRAVTIAGSSELGVQVAPEDVPEIDCIVSGSVAVTPDGDRVGKGEGYSDLEFAVLREFGLVDDDTPVVTTVHDLQVVDEDVPVGPHDVSLDLVATPSTTYRPEPRPKPTGLDWDLLDEERLSEIPVLARLAENCDWE